TDTIASNTTIQNTDNSLKWGNITSALRWNHTLSPSLFLNVAATYSQYNFGISGEQTTTVTSSSDSSQIANLFSRIESVSGIKDYGLKADVDFISSNSHYIRFGGYGIQHHFKPGISSFNANEDVVSINPETIVTMEYGAYGEDDFSITSALKLNAGVHFSGLNVENTNYFFIQPRLTTSYLFNKNFSAKISFSYMTQYLHLLTNSGIGYPTDLWVPVTANIKPMISNQIVAGVSYLLGTKYHISVEGYYKAMDHVIEYKEGASFLNNKQGWESKVSVGNGESYGTEFFIEKKYGMWTGWIGYTLAWTYRQFYNINLEEIFPYRYDRRHDLEFTTSRSITKNIDFSANWVFGSGMPVTLPIAAFQTVGDYAAYDFYYGGRNSFRTRSYHRLDINFSFKKSKKYGERTWVVGLYNAYSRRNPFYTSVAYMTGEKARLEQYGIFPIFPSVSYNFKF
ncbi:MAG: TonB-dependent receptor, partial [Cyclobacteriaceae bacterium]|nr:TonB-dependent receptor [Cyclobacteriaceae bacterium]